MNQNNIVFKRQAYKDTVEIVKSAVCQPTSSGESISLNIWSMEDISTQIQKIYDKLLELQLDTNK